MIRIIRATTVPSSLNAFCRGMLRELSMKYEVIALSSPGEELAQVAQREGVRTISVPMERHISLLRDFKALLALLIVFLKEKPTMVHSMTPKAGLLCMTAAWIARVPVRVHTFTGLVFPTTVGLKRRVLMATDKITCFCATHIIPEGEGVKTDLIYNGITKKELRVLGFGNIRGVDLNYYSRREEVTRLVEELDLRDNNSFTFLFVGRIVRDKGINELCEAFDRLSQIVSSRLILIGDYEDSLDPISDKARKLIDINPSLQYVGPRYGDELLAYYAAADCFVFPSYREGFPNTVIEAGAMGLPCIVTDINGSREIISQRENGVVIPPKNPDALFNAMLEMISDESGRNLMASKARSMIASRFEQGFVRHCLYEFYEDILRTKEYNV